MMQNSRQSGTAFGGGKMAVQGCGSIREDFGEPVILNLAANQLRGDPKLTRKIINLFAVHMLGCNPIAQRSGRSKKLRCEGS